MNLNEKNQYNFWPILHPYFEYEIGCDLAGDYTRLLAVNNEGNLRNNTHIYFKQFEMENILYETKLEHCKSNIK